MMRWLPWAGAAALLLSLYAAARTYFAGAFMTRNESVPQAMDHTFQGKPAPDLRLTGLDGREHSLAGLRGKPVVLVFWTTW